MKVIQDIVTRIVTIVSNLLLGIKANGVLLGLTFENKPEKMYTIVFTTAKEFKIIQYDIPAQNIHVMGLDEFTELIKQ